MRTIIKTTSLCLLLATLAGCGAGYNHVLFTTKSNAGIDIDTEPPTFKADISRSEGVIEPVFEEGKTLPVSASFKTTTSGLETFFFGVGSTFATGEAAVAMTALYGYGDTEYIGGDGQGEIDFRDGVTDTRETTITQYKGETLSRTPMKKSLLGRKRKPVKFLDQGLVKPVLFGTDTSLGVNVGWSNPTSPAPQSIHVGFKRKELAWAPVTLKELSPEEKAYLRDPSKGENNQAIDPDAEFRVNIPSLLATLDTGVGASGAQGGADIKWLQYFATGRAATNYSLHRAVRSSMLAKTDPAAAKAIEKNINSSVYDFSKESALIDDFWRPGGTRNPANEKEILDWMDEHDLPNNPIALDIANLIEDEVFKSRRPVVVQGLNLPR